ncbi:potassium channel family protein [Alkaliphilus transvaalensis]|uniref:potassium channel family protein n=1 Tax=Alkaliphilus transvaalensis TaxID=114628 RepID=UPI00047CFD92|nr:potassium channel family protein [Alkaliphilus transvaalensis]
MEGSILIFKDCILNTFLNISLKGCKGIRFDSEVVNNGIININAKNKFDFLSIEGLLNIGTIEIDWVKNNVKDLIIRGQCGSYLDLAKQFLILKESYNKLGYYDYEDEAYILFKRYQMKNDLKEFLEYNNIFKKIWGLTKYLNKKIVFDYIGEFGMNPIRIGGSMFLVILLFGIIYAFCPYIEFAGTNMHADILSKLYESLYFSGITFLTIGYGDIQPIGLTRILTIIEGFLGLFLMSYFVVAFSRKVIR